MHALADPDLIWQQCLFAFEEPSVDRRFSAANEQALIFAPYYRESLVLVRDTRVLPDAPTVAQLNGMRVAAE